MISWFGGKKKRGGAVPGYAARYVPAPMLTAAEFRDVYAMLIEVVELRSDNKALKRELKKQQGFVEAYGELITPARRLLAEIHDVISSDAISEWLRRYLLKPLRRGLKDHWQTVERTLASEFESAPDESVIPSKKAQESPAPLLEGEHHVRISEEPGSVDHCHPHAARDLRRDLQQRSLARSDQVIVARVRTPSCDYYTAVPADKTWSFLRMHPGAYVTFSSY